MSADAAVPPVAPVGRPSAFPDVVAWLEGLRDVALDRGHDDAVRHALKALDIIRSAQASIEHGFCVDPALLVALLGVPRR